VPVTRAQSNSMSKREESGNQLDDLVSTPKMIVSEYLTKHFPLQSTKLSNRDVDALIHLVPLRMCHGSALAACSLEQACLPGQAWLVSGKFLCAGNCLLPALQYRWYLQLSCRHLEAAACRMHHHAHAHKG